MDGRRPDIARPECRTAARAVSHASTGDLTAIEAELLDPARRVAASDFPRADDDVSLPGLYAWFVDESGASDLSAALGGDVAPGLIYVGQAGAGLSEATLASRIGEKHLHGNVRVSTFRFTLGSALTDQLDLHWIGARQMDSSSETAVSAWMAKCLSVAVVPVADRSRLDEIQDGVVDRLDPVLNLRGMSQTPVRGALARSRGAWHAHAGVAATGDAPDIKAFLESLVGSTIFTLHGSPNRITAVTANAAVVVSDRSPHGRPFPLAPVQDAANRLFESGELKLDVKSVGYRSAFIGAVLSALPDTEVQLDPPRILRRTAEGSPPAGPESAL
jgi:hypothetical protein